MTEEQQTTGTPEPDDGDAQGTATTGTPAADDRDASSTSTTEPDWKAIALANKSKVEEANRILADHARARVESPPADSNDDDGQGGDEDKYWQETEDFARRGDPVAKAAIHAREENKQLRRTIADTFTLRDITDKDEQQEVYKHYQRNRHRLGDVGAARAEVRERKLADKVATLQKELDASKAATQKRVQTSDVVRTHSREVPAKEANERRKMTFDQFDAEVARLKKAGQWNAAMQLQQELNRDEIDIDR